MYQWKLNWRGWSKIIKVDQPSEWVNEMSVDIKRSGDIRICIDPRPLKFVFKRERYKLQVLDDVIPKLFNFTRFAVCDLR